MSIMLWHYEDRTEDLLYVKATEIPLVEDTGINLKSTSPPRFSNTIATKAIRACGNTEMHLIFINSTFIVVLLSQIQTFKLNL